MKSWKRIEPTEVIKGKWRTLTTKTFELPDGQTSAFETFDVDGINHAHVIALTPDHKVIVAEQFRPGPEKVMAELPGGTVDPGEDPQVAALRELREETCYKAGKVEKLGAYHKDAYMNATWHVYIAWDCERVSDKQDTPWDELINIKLISVQELIDNAKNDRMTDAQSVLIALDKLIAIRKQ